MDHEALYINVLNIDMINGYNTFQDGKNLHAAVEQIKNDINKNIIQLSIQGYLSPELKGDDCTIHIKDNENLLQRIYQKLRDPGKHLVKILYEKKKNLR